MRKRTKAQTVFDRYDRILIDTSTLMNFEPLKLFLTGYEDRIRGSETQIVMPGSVQMELARHIGSGNHDKADGVHVLIYRGEGKKALSPSGQGALHAQRRRDDDIRLPALYKDLPGLVVV